MKSLLTQPSSGWKLNSSAKILVRLRRLAPKPRTWHGRLTIGFMCGREAPSSDITWGYVRRESNKQGLGESQYIKSVTWEVCKRYIL